MPWYDPFKTVYEEDIRPSVKETAEEWWENEFKPAVEKGVDDFFDSLIPKEAEEWVQEHIVVPATKEVVTQTLKDNAVYIGIALAATGIVIAIAMKR